jgi:WG containing repeat
VKLAKHLAGRIGCGSLGVLHRAAAKVLAAGLMLFASLVLMSCQRAPVFSGDWRDLRQGEEDDRWGYVDRSGKFMIKPQFSIVAPFSEGLAWVGPKNKGYGYIDKTGAWVVKPQFNHALEFSEGLAAVSVHGRWGYINATGNYAVAPQFDDAQSFSEGLAPVKKGELWGYIDKTGRFVIEPRFPDSSNFLYGKSSFSGGVAVVQAKYPYFELIDRNGNVIKKVNASRVGAFHDGLALVAEPENGGTRDRRDAFINTAGEFAFPQRFDEAREFSDGLALARVGNQFGYIDTTGRFVIPPRFFAATAFSEGLAAGRLDGHDPRWTFIDKTGRTVFQLRGDGRVEKFKGGLAAMDLNCPRGYLAEGAQWGYVDKTGKVVCTFLRGH